MLANRRSSGWMLLSFTQNFSRLKHSGFCSLLLIVHFLLLQISKKQYEIVKSMKQSGRSIQFRSLNRVLGNDCNIQPYHVFVEEEQKNLHKHWLVWVYTYILYIYIYIEFLDNFFIFFILYLSCLCRLQLARKDLPVAYAIWMEMRLQRRKMIMSLETNMKERLESVMEVCDYSLCPLPFSAFGYYQLQGHPADNY